MDFRTKIEIPKPGLDISHKSRILMFGSCFIENIGNLLIKDKFNVNLNPFGILYNPISISQSLQLLIDNKIFTEKDIFEYKGLYHSLYFHSNFSDTSKDKCLATINHSINKSSNDLREADVLIITFGTAYVFYSKEQERIVSNCHKLPDFCFYRYKLSVDNIIREWDALLKSLKEINPKLQFIFTISPIRHMKDGAHENQLSKSTLLLAVDKLCELHSHLHYFPSYEIVLDELRDYRFYNEDMVHPNNVAIKYIWERFSETYFDKEVYPLIDEWQKIYQAINHRPLNSESDEYKAFLRQTMLKIETFKKKYPYICCNDEISNLEMKL